MQRKEQLWVSALGNEKLGWGGEWELSPKDLGGGTPEQERNQGNRITPKNPGSAHSRPD